MSKCFIGHFLLFYRIKDDVQTSSRGHVTRSNDMELESGNLLIKSGPGKPIGKGVIDKCPIEQHSFLKVHAEDCTKDNASIHWLQNRFAETTLASGAEVRR